MGATKQKIEKADDGFKFEVGAMYENMKGDYEVISIQKDSMLIRWRDGNEVVTSVDLQRRIIDRMAYEKKLRQEEEIKSQEKAQKKTKRKN
jgi:hypothetical protein